MLKKTGIIVSAATAGVLALGGFAFATTPHHDAPAPVNHTNVQKDNVGNDCTFDQSAAKTQQTATGGDGLLGVGGAVSGIVAPVDTPIQALNCTNINTSDLIDSNSNNDSRTATSTETTDSGNTTVADHDHDHGHGH